MDVLAISGIIMVVMCTVLYTISTACTVSDNLYEARDRDQESNDW